MGTGCSLDDVEIQYAGTDGYSQETGLTTYVLGVRNRTDRPFTGVLIASIIIPDHGICIWQQPRTVESWFEDCGECDICRDPSPDECCQDSRDLTGEPMQYFDFAAHPLPPGEGNDYLVSFAGYGFGIRPNIHVTCIEDSLGTEYDPVEEFLDMLPEQF